MMMKNNINSLRLREILFCGLLVIPFAQGTNWQYVVIFAFILWKFIQQRTVFISTSNKSDRIAASFIVVWFLGVLVGVMNRNAITDVFSNFAGMTVYILYFALSHDIKWDSKKIFKCLYTASIIASFEIVIVYLFRTRGITLPWPFTNIRYNQWTHSIITGMSVLSYVLVAVSLFNILHEGGRKKKLLNLLLLLISTFSIIGTTDSGGALLGYVAVFGTVLFLSPATNRKSKFYWFFSVGIFLIVIALALAYEYKNGIMREVFSLTSSGNSKRYYQFQLVFDRFKLFGNGLGARVDYSIANSAGSIREIDSYGMEVSYLNLVDKFGIISIILIANYIYSYIRPIRMLFKGIGIPELNILVIGLLGYLFVALGNPVLFSPYNVVLHVIALIIMSENSKCTIEEIATGA